MTELGISFQQAFAYFKCRLPHEKIAKRDVVSVHCPFHEDKNPSMSLSLARGVWHCHGCNLAGGILDFERKMFPGDSVEKAWNEIQRITGIEPPTRRRHVVESYDYTNERGVLLYQKLRYEPKQFSLRQPDDKGGWHYNVEGVKRVLYRLPEVVTSSMVAICEGEKDCDNLSKAVGEAWGACTCNFDGAGKWKDEYSPYFTGRMVVVLADNDPAGIAHAESVAASVAKYAATVKVLHLPGLPVHGDVSDWLAQGHSGAEFLQLVKAAPVWKPQTSAKPPPNGFRLVDLGELLSRPVVPDDYVLEGMLLAGTLSFVVAKPKVGKSTLARGLCLAVAQGAEFLGRKTKQGACIYLALEERAEDVTADFRAMGASSTDPIKIHADTAPEAAILSLVNFVLQEKPALVVIDPMIRMVRVKDENAYAEMYAALGPLIDAARSSGTHVLLTHHAGKAKKSDPIDAPLGTQGIGGAVHTLVVLERTDGYRTIQTVQRKGTNMEKTVLTFEPSTLLLSMGGTKTEADRGECEREIIDCLKTRGEMTEPEIADNVEAKTTVKRKALRSLVEKGAVKRTCKGRKGEAFKYSLSCSPPIPEAGEQESTNGLQYRRNNQQMLVPENTQRMLVPGICSERRGTLLDVEV